MNLTKTLNEMKLERDSAAKRLSQLEDAIGALEVLYDVKEEELVSKAVAVVGGDVVQIGGSYVVPTLKTATVTTPTPRQAAPRLTPVLGAGWNPHTNGGHFPFGIHRRDRVDIENMNGAALIGFPAHAIQWQKVRRWRLVKAEETTAPGTAENVKPFTKKALTAPKAPKTYKKYAHNSRSAAIREVAAAMIRQYRRPVTVTEMLPRVEAKVDMSGDMDKNTVIWNALSTGKNFVNNGRGLGFSLKKGSEWVSG